MAYFKHIGVVVGGKVPRRNAHVLLSDCLSQWCTHVEGVPLRMPEGLANGRAAEVLLG